LDYLRAWRGARNPQSFQGQELNARTENFARPDGHAGDLTRKAVKDLTDVMAEAVRVQQRKDIRLASSICLLVDDKSPWRLVLYRLDGLAPCSREMGVLAVLHHGGPGESDNLDVFAEDHADRMARSLLAAITAFATPLGGSVDQGLADHILSHVHVYTSDGAALKCGRILRQTCTNCVLTPPPHAAPSLVGPAPPASPCAPPPPRQQNRQQLFLFA
jgi:hypothetical protein